MPGVAELHLEEEREPGAGVAETEERARDAIDAFEWEGAVLHTSIRCGLLLLGCCQASSCWLARLIYCDALLLFIGSHSAAAIVPRAEKIALAPTSSTLLWHIGTSGDGT